MAEKEIEVFEGNMAELRAHEAEEISSSEEDRGRRVGWAAAIITLLRNITA